MVWDLQEGAEHHLGGLEVEDQRERQDAGREGGHCVVVLRRQVRAGLNIYLPVNIYKISKSVS